MFRREEHTAIMKHEGECGALALYQPDHLGYGDGRGDGDRRPKENADDVGDVQP